MTAESPRSEAVAAIAVLAEQIRSIADSMAEIRSLFRALDERMRNSELRSAGTEALNQSRLDAAHRRIDENEKRIIELNSRLQPIEQKVPLLNDVLEIRTKLIVLVFASGFLGTSLGALVLGLLFNYLFSGLIVR